MRALHAPGLHPPPAKWCSLISLPMSLALIIIVFTVLVSSAISTLLTFAPLFVFFGAITYFVHHVGSG